jgi:hypothetical protein
MVELTIDELADRTFEYIPFADDIPVLLDSSSPIITLPLDVLSPIYEWFDAKPDTLLGTPVYVVDCAWRNHKDTGIIDFTFHILEIDVLWSDLILDLSPLGVDKCILMIYPSEDGIYRLGGELRPVLYSDNANLVGRAFLSGSVP